MINSQLKDYEYYIYGESNDYGEQVLPDKPTGTIQIAINLLSNAITDNALYSTAEYIGLTHDDITDKYVICYNNEKLKVLYTNSAGRFTQAWMVRI